MHEISPLIVSVSSVGSDESALMRMLVGAFAALIHEVWMSMKAQTEIQPSIVLLDIATLAFIRGICDQQRNLVYVPLTFQK